MKAFKFKTRRFNQLSMAARNASTEKTELAGISCRLSKKRSPRSPNTSRSARARFVGGPVWRLLADESHRCIPAVGSKDDDDCGILHPTLPSQTARTKPWRIPRCGAAFHAFCGRSCATGRPSRKACPELVEGCRRMRPIMIQDAPIQANCDALP